MKTPDQKRTFRRWLMFWISLPVAIVGLVFSFKLLSMAPTAQTAIDAFDRGSYQTSADVSSSLLEWNIAEQWIPYFNRGDALLGSESYVESIDDLEKALELAPVEKQCDVRVNLALAWELLADGYVEGGFYQGAVLLYEASEAVMDAAGEECAPPPDEKPEDSSQQIEESGERVEQKKQDAEERRDAQPEPEEGDSQTETERKLEELGQNESEGAQEKADEDAGDRGGDGDGGFPDKPW